VNGGRSRVVVGVDGSPGARAALEWAWAAAARRGVPLRVVSAFPVDDYWTDVLLLDPRRLDTLRSDTTHRVRALVTEVRAASGAAGTPEVAVDVTVVAGAPAEHLVQLSEGADLLVVGSRGRGGVRSTLLGSVALHCVTSAACPVVVVHPAPVHPAPVLPAADETVATAPRVVVGLDDSGPSDAALAGAVEFADELGAEVEAVVAVQLPAYWGELEAVVPVPLAEVREQAVVRARELVAEVLGGGEQPPVRVVDGVGPAAAVLVERSVGAALLVVGSRSRSRLPGMLLGSVALHCVVHAPCPVMVVHPAAAGRRRTTGAPAPVLAG
jgi:nucleotide-binding universal stress UspA family protein